MTNPKNRKEKWYETVIRDIVITSITLYVGAIVKAEIEKRIPKEFKIDKRRIFWESVIITLAICGLIMLGVQLSK